MFPNTGSTEGVSTFPTPVIEGYGFAEGYPSPDVFSFGGTTETGNNASCFSHDGCEMFIPAHAAGTADITVTVNGATSLKTKADKYTYK
jgi:hypothetical protein